MYISQKLITACQGELASDYHYMYDELVRCMRVGTYFEEIINTEPEVSTAGFRSLDEEKIHLGAGGFVLLMVYSREQLHIDIPLDFSLTENRYIIDLDRLFREDYTTHIFTNAGRLFLLLNIGKRKVDEVIGICRRLIQLNLESALRFIVSECAPNKTDIFHCCNSLKSSYDYLKFVTDPPEVYSANVHRQMTSSYNSGTEDFDALAGDIATAMTVPDFQPESWADASTKLIVHNNTSSIEAIHQNIQKFAICLSRKLLDRVVTDAEFISQSHLISRLMTMGKNEQNLNIVIGGILREIYSRHRALSGRAASGRILEIKTYITDNISDYTLNVAGVAEKFEINRNLLTSEFKKYCGMTISAFINRARVQYAKELLVQNPEMSLEQVAEASGYVSASTMYRGFQKLERCSPGALRKKIQST